MNSKRLGAAGALILFLAGCATSANSPEDPLEGFNRKMFEFNDKVDKVALQPVAKAYQAVVPTFVQTGVGNFFGNLEDVWTLANNILQGKINDGLSDMMRVAVNSVLGLGGILNIASEAGLPKHQEDFGQTLGKWGVASGPYIVLPFLGSSTLRDSAALPIDWKGNLWSYKYPIRWRNTGKVVALVDQRASLLDASNLLETAAIDRYTFVRSAYLQRRKNKINDGQTTDKSQQELYEEDSDAADSGTPAETGGTSKNATPASAAASVPASTTANTSNPESDPEERKTGETMPP